MDKNKATAIIEKTFDQAFDKQTFIQFIQNLLNDIEIINNDYNVDDDTFREYISRYTHIGNYTDPHGETVDILLIDVCEESKLDKARTSLRNFAVDHLKRFNHNYALAAYYSKSDGGNKWRFSFIKIEHTTSVKDGKIKQEEDYSPAKRYSFVVGKDRYNRTAKERLLPILVNDYDNPAVEQIENAFSVETLTRQFYTELFDWYLWALSDEMNVTYPNDINTETDNRIIQEHLIRLITRLMFVWFIKQKKLIPDDIFDTVKLQEILEDFDPESTANGNYYNAILQNLFFATLNRPVNERVFAVRSTIGKSDGKEHYGIKTLFRDNNQKTWFSKPQNAIIDLFRQVPFLNGGLFECLDKENAVNKRINYFDGFSRDERNKRGMLIRTFIPNRLFFDRNKGLISILKRYNFTIEENTPYDVDVALDPELLGKVFENLLGAYNPETKETARKQSGSFYTPREIVNYMVDESLIAYLKQQVGEEYEREYRKLLIGEPDSDITLKSRIYNALKNCKILDPACGSGAFPMGILNRIICMMEHLGLPPNISIFDLKLHLIENCIFGADIQTIAVQISKLRFFISLIVEQTPTNDAGNNYGITPLPNLETQFVAANTLAGIKKKKEGDFIAFLFENPQIEVTKKSLLEVRHMHFSADTAKKKEECRKKDKELREKLACLLKENNEFAFDDANQLATWNPYDQNTSSPFFDPEWMFGLTQGFDIVIGNPPYVQLQNNGGELAKLYEKCGYKTFARTGDLYCLFYERAYQLLKPQGRLCFITSNKWMRAGYGENTRKFFVENTNPEQLIDFAGVKVFESATVDTNILMFAKDKNRQQTRACVVKKDSIKDLSVFVRQNASVCSFNSDSWVVLSPIEQSIKAKIEAVGTPLKDWDINIYRGILTGYNEAFIINGKKKDELITEDPQSAEIIRPILRGRDIKRYGYDFSDKWLINTHNGIKEKGIKPININDYPTIKKHLDKYYPELEKRQDKGETPYNLRNCAYIEDFYKQKIVYPGLMRIAKSNSVNFPRFALDLEEHFFFGNDCYFIVSKNIEYLWLVLNSTLLGYLFRYYIYSFDETGFKIFTDYFQNIPIPAPNEDMLNKAEQLIKNKADIDEINKWIYSLYNFDDSEIAEIENSISVILANIL
jgi:hypothetical protein